MNLVAALLLVGLGQGLLLVGLLVLRRDLRTASTLCLAGLIAAVVLSGLEDAALHFGWLDRLPGLAGLTLPLVPLIGPFLKGHIEAVLTRKWHLSKHHAPWLAVLALAEAAAVVFLLFPGTVRFAVLTDRTEGDAMALESATLALLLVHLLSAGLIAIALFSGLRDVRRRAQGVEPAEALASRLVWLRGVLALVGFSWLAYASSLAAGLIAGFPADLFQGVAGVIQVASLYALGLLGLVRPDRMLPPPGEMLAAVVAPATGKYGRSALDVQERQCIAAALTRKMNEQRLYSDPLLTLPRLAAAIGVSANDLSQTINTEFGLSYHDYMARRRVEAAQAILRDPNRKETLTDILLEVGFNSKSVFNAAFKRETGLTPSEFRRQALADATS